MPREHCITESPVGLSAATLGRREELTGGGLIRSAGGWAPGKERNRVKARSLLCYWAARDVGFSKAELSKWLTLSISGVALAVKRGEQISREGNYFLLNKQRRKF